MIKIKGEMLIGCPTDVASPRLAGVMVRASAAARSWSMSAWGLVLASCGPACRSAAAQDRMRVL